MTPRLRELEARERERHASLAAAQPPAWLELAYAHPDDESPMQGAPYRVTFTDGSVREGRLDGQGRARLDGLSPALADTPVDVAFGDPAPPYRAMPRPEDAAPNPDYRGVGALGSVVAPAVQLASAGAGADAMLGIPWSRSLFEGMPKAADEAAEFLWALIAGAYKKDPTNGQIVGQILVTLIPVVGQIAAARDATAFIYRLTRPGPHDDRETIENSIGLVLSLMALVPDVGGAVAGVLRLARRGGRAVEVPLEAVLGVLNRLGRGAALHFAVERLTVASILADVRAQFRRVIGLLDAICREILKHDRLLPQEALVGAGRLQRELRAAERGAERWLQPAVEELVRPLEKAVHRAELTLMEKVAARGTTNAEARAAAPVQDVPAAGHVADETFASARARAGRSGKQARLRELADDDKLGSADRGWIKQDMNSIERGQRRNIRNPPGKDLAHRRGYEARKGYGYEHSDLQDRDLHRLQHKHEGYR